MVQFKISPNSGLPAAWKQEVKVVRVVVDVVEELDTKNRRPFLNRKSVIIIMN